MIYNLGMYFGVSGNSAWDTVKKLRESGKISETGAANLKNAISFATSLRLTSYAQSDSQTGMISTYIPALEHLEEQEKNKIIKTMFHIEDRKDLYDFFYVMVEFIKIINLIFTEKEFGTNDGINLLKNSNLFDDSCYTKGRVHAKFLEYDKAIEFLKIEEENPNQLRSSVDLFFLYDKTGTIEKMLEIAQKAVILTQETYKDELDYPYIAMSYNNLGEAYSAPSS